MPIVEEKIRSPYFKSHLDQLPKHYKPTRISRNKYIGGNIRACIERVFGAMGSWEGMMAWAKDNPDLFYANVIPKLLPAELAESGAGQQIRVVVYGVPSGEVPTQPVIDVSKQIMQAEAKETAVSLVEST